MRCWHCGNEFTPETTGEKPVEVNCSGCGAKLGLYSPVKEAPPAPQLKRNKRPALPLNDLDPPPMPPRQKAGHIALLLCAMIFLAIGGVMALNSHEIVTTYERAQGHLIRKENVRTGRRVSCIGTISFTAHDGQNYHAEIGGAHSMRIGDPVKVLYRRDNPHDNRTDATSAVWGFPLAFGGIGCVLMIVWMVSPGLGPMYLSNTRRRWNDE